MLQGGKTPLSNNNKFREGRFGSREHMLPDDSDADVHFKIEDI